MAGRARAVLAVAVVAAVAAACGGGGSPAGTSAPHRTVEYAPGLTEDVYQPATDARRVPLVVMVPGGSWRTADPAGLTDLAEELARRGVAAAPTHIRAAEDGVTYPVPVEDVLCAVAGAVAEVRDQGLVPDPVVVLGHSSGAHLAALAVLAVRAFSPSCEAPLVVPDALVGLSGPYDVTRVPGLASALLGSTPDEHPGAWADADAVARAALRPHVPVLLIHGDADETVPVDLTVQLADALRAAGHPTTVDIVPGADHFSVYEPDVEGARVASWLLALPRAS
jgi:acetyl esterase/lipase